MKRLAVIFFVFLIFSGMFEIANVSAENYFENPPFSDDYIVPVKVKSGKENYVNVRVSEEHLIAKEKGSRDIIYVLTLPEYINAPVKKGQNIGMVSFYCEDVLLYQADMLAEKSISKRNFKYVFRKTFVKMLNKNC
ncbi:MAG: hypothetical protein PUB76_05820 [Oscillospiraceae bacterium]|nr:hypothetical protein [Oscillospiraceae bacterium]